MRVNFESKRGCQNTHEYLACMEKDAPEIVTVENVVMGALAGEVESKCPTESSHTLR
jgi:hypothetical protein